MAQKKQEKEREESYSYSLSFPSLYTIPYNMLNEV